MAAAAGAGAAGAAWPSADQSCTPSGAENISVKIRENISEVRLTFTTPVLLGGSSVEVPGLHHLGLGGLGPASHGGLEAKYFQENNPIY